MKILKPYIVELAPTLTGHWYNVWKVKSDGSKGRFLGTFPSSTTILNAYPQSEFLTKWIADNGWQESQRIKSEAGERGTKIHTACDLLEEGIVLNKGDYSLEEWWKISTFVRWYDLYNPETIVREFPVFSAKGKYAGRLDRIYLIQGENIILDFKSSSNIHEHFPLQFSSYAKAVEETTDLKISATAALQLGAKNKDGYRYILYPEWKDHYKVFESVRKVWQYEYFDSKKNPKSAPVLELPDTLQLESKVAEKKINEVLS
jgi:hypothetical protein